MRQKGTATLLINAANLHVGGGVQVATSVLSELGNTDWRGLTIRVLASTEVADNLRRLAFDPSTFAFFEVIDVFGPFRGARALQRRLRAADAVFTIFGPLYAWPKPKLSIVGFAQPWIAYPDNDVLARLSTPARIKARLKHGLQRLAFQLGSDAIFVEAEHMRDRLVKLGVFDATAISVIPNALNAVFLDPSLWSAAPRITRRDGALLLGVVSRDYAHKNLDALPAIKRHLHRDHGLDVDIAVTLTAGECARKSEAFRSAVVNVGPLAIDECPDFYSQLDGVVFPSLLEAFSAAPLEAMYMRKPLFASERPFIRDACGEFANYFDPNSPADAAQVVADHFRSGVNVARLEAARDHVLQQPTARDRAQAYIDQIADLIAKRSAIASRPRRPDHAPTASTLVRGRE